MVTYRELLGNNSITDVPISYQHNGEELLKRINIVRNAYGFPFIITSGLRSWQEHCRIYGRSNPPKGSQHLIFAAADIADPDKKIYNWVEANTHVLDEADLFYELGTKNWLHLQIFPFKSYKVGGTRGFLP